VEPGARRGRVVAARLVGVHGYVRRGDVDQRVVGGRHRVDVVDDAVAVVVEAVAGLDARLLYRTDADVGGLGAVALQDTGAGAGAGAVDAGLADLVRLVGDAVAVVVEAVAAELGVLVDLVGRRVVADPAVLPRAGRLDAGADAPGEAGDVGG